MIKINIKEVMNRLQLNGAYQPKINQSFIQKIYDLIVENMQDSNFGVKELATKMGVSHSQLYRRIKAKTDKSPAIYCRSLRLQIARKLLLSSNLNISEIAYRTGFNDPSYFSRAFYKEFGLTPSNLRT